MLGELFRVRFEAEAKRALDTANARGADYADVRFGAVHDEHVEVSTQEALASALKSLGRK